jgi:hypothetical protein
MVNLSILGVFCEGRASDPSTYPNIPCRAVAAGGHDVAAKKREINREESAEGGLQAKTAADIISNPWMAGATPKKRKIAKNQEIAGFSLDALHAGVSNK